MSEKTKAKRKYDLRSSIILLLLIAILLFSSTYAWFTANQTVTVNTLNVHIEAQNGLQISTDATTWKSIIENTDITTAYTGHTNKIPANIEPVSTIGEIDSTTGYMKMYYGSANADEADSGAYKLTATQTTDAEGKYIVFDMFLRVDKDTRLKMTQASSVVMKQNSTDKGIKQASRVAFCVEGTEAAGTSLDTIRGLKGAQSFLKLTDGNYATNPDSTVYIWEPNPNLHTDAAVAHARDNYGITTTAEGTAAPVEYYGITQPISTGIKLIDTNNGNDTTNFAKVTPNYKESVATDTGKMPETEIFSLSAGITKVRVYMWIEGQDVDCENTASGTDISYNLQFQVIDETT